MLNLTPEGRETLKIKRSKQDAIADKLEETISEGGVDDITPHLPTMILILL